MDTRVFHWGNLQRTKTPKALIAHLVNEMTQKILQKFPQIQIWILPTVAVNFINKNQIDNFTHIFQNLQKLQI